MKVKSKVDLWIKILIYLVILLMIWSVSLAEGIDQIIIFLIFSIVTIFLLSFLFYTYYELRQDYIYIRAGILLYKIKYKNISTLKLSENFLSSAALSRKRIEIREKNKGFITGTTYISPINREEFLKKFKEKCGMK